MPLTWKVDHGVHLIVATASGSLTRQDIDDYLAAVVVEGAIGYRVIFDALAASLALRPADLAAFSHVVKGRKTEVSSGAIAIVIGSDAEREMGVYFVDRTSGQRPCRLFQRVAEARAWLDSLDDGPSPSSK